MNETHVSKWERFFATAANVSVSLTFIITVVKEIIAWWTF